MKHSTLDEALTKTGFGVIVLQDDGSETVYDNPMEAIHDAYQTSDQGERELSEEHLEKLKKNLAKARDARKIRSQEKSQQKAALQEMKRNENPAKYDEIRAKKVAALEKARAARKEKRDAESKNAISA